MIHSRKEFSTRGEWMEQTTLQGRPRLQRPTPVEGPRWSPALALGFLGLIIASAMAGIITLLSAIARSF